MNGSFVYFENLRIPVGDRTNPEPIKYTHVKISGKPRG
ncbi:hypothetical protein CKA32_001643 [Geitlerinema sp. FC II]|nr:hypothetical protein CKA32_001643 [Geitlerinema sp. FC II]